MSGIPCVLVGHTKLFGGSGGGVQHCTREHVALLEAGGFAIRKLEFEFDNSPFDRIARRFSSPRDNPPTGLLGRLDQALRLTQARHVFFALDAFEHLSRSLRRAFPHVTQILLSHGVEAVDVLVEQRLGETVKGGRPGAALARKLGRELVVSAARRKWLAGVVVLSPFEIEIEKWLGTKASLWAPAIILEKPLSMKPMEGRIGCVTTLDHPPNAAGLIQLLEALQAPEFSGEFRLVGQPGERGASIAAQFPFVRYLGSLSDDDLRQEASTWCSFINPIFVCAKGRSTKVGQALGWSLPIATTEFGVRGYIWDQTLLPTPATPASLAQLVIEQSRLSNFDRHRRMTQAIAAISPRVDTVGQQVRTFVRAVSEN